MEVDVVEAKTVDIFNIEYQNQQIIAINFEEFQRYSAEVDEREIAEGHVHVHVFVLVIQQQLVKYSEQRAHHRREVHKQD